jgi:nucleoside-diphosphate-sugar epimerase
LEGPAVSHCQLDRDAEGGLERALGEGAEVLIDVIPYTEAHARQLLGVSERVGSIIAISSASVYVDDRGRTIDEAESWTDYPELPVPIRVGQATVSPGDSTYSAGKVAVERTLLDDARVPVTIVRPGAVHGPGSRHAREWYFVKRALDRRPVVVLAFDGRSIFHTTSVANLAALVLQACERPDARIVNCGDPDALSVLDIGRAVARQLDYEPDFVLVAREPPAPNVGETPWSLPNPFVLDMSDAAEFGYSPVVGYEKAVAETCAWLREATRNRDWREVLPVLAQYPNDPFDYRAEDDYLTTLGS